MEDLYFTGLTIDIQVPNTHGWSTLPLSIVISQVTSMVSAKNHQFVVCESCFYGSIGLLQYL
jgi:hypothetical protein